jgi:nucleolar protein 15
MPRSQNQNQRVVPLSAPAHSTSVSANSGPVRPSKRPKTSASSVSISKSTVPLHAAGPSPVYLRPRSSPASGSDDAQAGAETHLRGFSPDSDSSDEDSNDDKIDEDAIDISRLPTVAKDDLSVRRKLARAQQQHARILRSCHSSIY